MIRKLVNPRLRFIVEPTEGEGGTAGEVVTDDQTDATGTEPDAGQAEGVAPTDEPNEGEKDAAWLTKELERTRRESANYRTQLREAQEALGKTKTPEEFEAALKEFGDKTAAIEASLTRERVARTQQVPAELFEFLVGNTEEELTASAKKLVTLFGSAAEVDPNRLGGGLTPADDDKFDPVAVAKKARGARF